MKIKTADLIGPALDWAVAKCEGIPVYDEQKCFTAGWIEYDEFENISWSLYEYSTDWSQGGPIIEREQIGLFLAMEPEHPEGERWSAFSYRVGSNKTQFGPTPLVSAMRAYVASKIGDEVEVPDDLA